MVKTAPCGRGSESVLNVYSDILSRDHRERSARRVLQRRARKGPVVQRAEATGSKSVESGFESQRGHQQFLKEETKMANKTLFASLRDALIPQTNTVNSEGAPAYAPTSKQALAQYAATGGFGRTFYASADR